MSKAASTTHRRVLAGAASALAVTTQAQAILETCTISATSVAFGNYDPTSATPRDSTGTVTVTCTAVVGLFSMWTVMLNQGNSGSFSTRKLTNGAQSLNYNLYLDAARTIVWGDGTSGTSYISDGQTLLVGSNPYNYTVYGRIPVAQDVAALVYLDTITATLNY